MKNFIKRLVMIIFVGALAMVMIRAFMFFGPVYKLSLNGTTLFMKSPSMIDNVSFWGGILAAIVTAAVSRFNINKA